MRTVMTLFVLVTTMLFASAASAHGTRAASIDVTEIAPGKAAVHVRTTQPSDVVRVSFDAPCVTSSTEEDGESVMLVECPDSLASAQIRVSGLGPVLSEAILVVSLHDGARVSRVLTTDEPSFALPVKQSGFALARSYIRLGVVHILTGWDHLFFLVALVLLLRRPRKVLVAETAFTISHSLTFSATALGLVHVSAPAAEAAIALSLVLLALDIGRSGVDATAVKGAALAFVFGLVHGLGFAGGLAEIGLPDHDVAVALVGFGAGVEIGQVAFLLFVLALVQLVRRTLPRLEYERVAALGIGGLAFYWLIERMLTCLNSG